MADVYKKNIQFFKVILFKIHFLENIIKKKLPARAQQPPYEDALTILTKQ